MTGIVEQAARVMAGGQEYADGYMNLAQALADAGLLAEPARTVPTREQIEIAVGGVLFNASNHPDPGAILGKSIAPLRDKVTDAVLALMNDQPTVAEVKAEALEDLAREANDNTELDKTDRHLISNWCIVAAQQHRDGK